MTSEEDGLRALRRAAAVEPADGAGEPSSVVEPVETERVSTSAPAPALRRHGTALRAWWTAFTSPGEVAVGEPVSAHLPERPRRRIDGRTVAYVLSGFVGTLLISSSAPLWRLSVPSWRLTLPGIPSPGISGLVSGILFGGGLVLMVVGWAGLIGRAERMPGTPRRRLFTVAGCLVLWTVPLFLAPPLLSNDVYSYVAQGEMASRGVDPSAIGPVVLGRGDILRAVDPVWRTAPAPYGPAWTLIGEGVVRTAGHSPVWSVWLFRLVAVAGVAMAAWGVVLIARHYRVSPAVALAVGIGNPLVLLYLIGGVHNDALMMGFLALGVAAALRDRRGLAIVLLSVATAIKLPAAASLIFVAWYFAGPGATFRQRLRALVTVLVPAAAIVAGLCVVAGIGTGWITALQNTGKVMDTFSLTTILGYFGTDLGRAAGLTDNPEAFVPLGRLIGLAVAGLLSLLLLLGRGRLGLARALGLSMLAVVFLGPVVWPWYLPAGFALLAAAGLGKFRPSYLVVCAACSALVWPTSVYPIPALIQYQRILSFFVIVAIAGTAWAAQRWAARRERAIEATADDEALPDPEGGVESQLVPA